MAREPPSDRKFHALWRHPRSVSTAFERIVREPGDLNAFQEPFMHHHHLTTIGRRFPDFAPETEHPTPYEDIRAMMRDIAETQAHQKWS